MIGGCTGRRFVVRLTCYHKAKRRRLNFSRARARPPRAGRISRPPLGGIGLVGDRLAFGFVVAGCFTFLGLSFQLEQFRRVGFVRDAGLRPQQSGKTLQGDMRAGRRLQGLLLGATDRRSVGPINVLRRNGLQHVNE